MAKQTRTVIHLQLIDTGEHYYFGSLQALCAQFGKDVIGIKYDSLLNRPPKPGEPFRNKYCIIRKGILVAMPNRKGSKTKKKKDVDVNN